MVWHAERFAALQDAISRINWQTASDRSLLEEHRSLLEDVIRKSLPTAFTSQHFATACGLVLEETEKSRARIREVPETAGSHLHPPSSLSTALRGVLRYFDIASKYALRVVARNVQSIWSMVTVNVDTSDSSSAVMLSALKLITGLPEQKRSSGEVQELYQVLEGKMRAEKLSDIQHGTKLAKWATRTFIWLISQATTVSDSKFAIVKSIARHLSSFEGDAESVLASITALSQFAKHSPVLFKPVAVESFQFAKNC